MRESFARNTADKLTIGLVVLAVIVGLGAYGAFAVLSDIGASSFTGEAGNRLDTLAADDATKNLYQPGATIRVDRTGSCGGTTSPHYVRRMRTAESVFAVVAFYQRELPRLGWVEKDTSAASRPRLVFRKEFDTGRQEPWVGELELKGIALPDAKTGYNVIATASPSGCDGP